MPVYGHWVLWYIQKERSFAYAGVTVTVPPGVFHPGLFFSTPVFIDFLQNVDFQEKKVLDIGTGSGLLALFAAKKGGTVTAIDINPLAVETCGKNAVVNRLTVQTIESDLFDGLDSGLAFDYLLINPPYFAAAPKDDAGRAFFAGEHLEYFEKLFRQMPAFIHAQTKIWMILSDDCDLDRINQMAGGQWGTVLEKRKWGKGLLILEFGCNVL